MLSTRIYSRALNLVIDNCRAAQAHCNQAELDHQVDFLIRLIAYCHARHGLTIDTLQNGMCGFKFVRNGYTPSKLYIDIAESKDCLLWKD